jgi:CheY-like chemotaxis protein
MSARVLVIDDSPTLRKVVGAILSRHGYEPLLAYDGRAGLELLETEKVDLILLDFVMPRMNGYQFCRELRAREELRSLPVVLMSAKAERIRDQFLQQTGAIDAITKPFDARALIAVVEGALERAGAGRVPSPPEADSMLDEDSLDASFARESLRPPPSSTGSTDRAKGAIIAAFSRALLPTITASFGLTEDQSGKLAQAVETAVTPELVAILRSALDERSAKPNPNEMLAGDLAAIPLGEILQVLQMQRQSGQLEITNHQVRVAITLRDGFIDMAQSQNASPEFRLGRYFVEEKVLTEDQLANAVVEATESKRLLGDLLVKKEIIGDEALHRALIRQTSEMIYEVLRWQKGRFALLREPSSPQAESARLGLPVAAIVMEGFRRVDEWRLIEESIQFDEVLLRNEIAIDTVPNALTTQERKVIDAVDGKRTVHELIEATHLSSFDTCKTLYRLLQSRLVRRRTS